MKKISELFYYKLLLFIQGIISFVFLYFLCSVNVIPWFYVCILVGMNISRKKTSEFISSEPTVHSFSTTRTDKQHHFRGAVFLFFIHFSFDFSHIYITSIDSDGIMNNSIHNRISMYTAT